MSAVSSADLNDTDSTLALDNSSDIVAISDDSSDALEISNDEEKQSYIGEFIYNHIFQNNFLKDYSEEKKIEYNSKITGIILKCGSSLNELAEMCQNKEILNKTISDTLKVFIKNKNE